MINKTSFFVGFFVILLILGFGYYYREGVSSLDLYFLNQSQPCQKPITYSIADVDSKFGLTKAKLLDDIRQAEKIWESPINKNLFEYSLAGDLKIHLIYDYRQKATDALRKLGIVINDDRSTYDAVKAKYDSLVTSYAKEKTNIAALIENYDADKSAYEKDVSYWNKRGGAPKREYDALEQKRINLGNQVAIINKARDSINELVSAINSTATVLNKLIADLNIQVSAYNTIGESAGKEFNEGEFVSNESGAAINIFQFNDENKLVKILAHELGHALGLGHLDNPEAIMYRIDEGINENLTADDLEALKNKCGIQ